MPYLAGFMMFAFFLGGARLVIAGVKEFILKLSRLSYFRRATGSVVSIERMDPLPDSDGFRHRKPHYRFFPIIEFRHLCGADVKFKSEVGDSGETSKYLVGQRIAVVYDIDDRFTPMINSFAGIWLPMILQAIGGAIFIGASLTIYLCFGEKIFGKAKFLYF
jgi:hypothetical protein